MQWRSFNFENSINFHKSPSILPGISRMSVTPWVSVDFTRTHTEADQAATISHVPSLNVTLTAPREPNGLYAQSTWPTHHHMDSPTNAKTGSPCFPPPMLPVISQYPANELSISIIIKKNRFDTSEAIQVRNDANAPLEKRRKHGEKNALS